MARGRKIERNVNKVFIWRCLKKSLPTSYLPTTYYIVKQSKHKIFFRIFIICLVSKQRSEIFKTWLNSHQKFRDDWLSFEISIWVEVVGLVNEEDPVHCFLGLFAELF
jgi:hypothetical protein